MSKEKEYKGLAIDPAIIECVEHRNKRHESLRGGRVWVTLCVTDNVTGNIASEVEYSLAWLQDGAWNDPARRCRVSRDLASQEEVLDALRNGFVAWNEEDPAKPAATAEAGKEGVA